MANNNALESIPADNVEKIEIITNPSARYEAAGTAGIINIILKKETNRGYGGTLRLSTGVPNDHRASVNLNLRREKFSAFGTVGLRLSNYNGSGDLLRTSDLPNNFSRLERVIDMNREDRNIQAYGGFDYFINERNTFTTTYSVYHVVNDDQSRMDFELFDADDQPTEIWDQTLDYLEPGTYHQLDFSLAKTLPREGESLTFYFRNDLWNEEETEDTRMDATLPITEEILRYRTNTIESSRDHQLEVNYERPLGQNGNLEVGLRGETRVISSDYRAENRESGEWEIIPGFENEFDYFERIGAAYLQYRFNKEKWGLQFGLRNEYTHVRVESASEAVADCNTYQNR
ncbi:MAG: outer membrane beta-barrel protein, partial [Bacteroidota bacterium]